MWINEELVIEREEEDKRSLINKCRIIVKRKFKMSSDSVS